MSRIVIVSNRLADPRKTAAGGLAVAIGDALQDSGGMWFGWSGRVVEPGQTAGTRTAQVRNVGAVTTATIDLTRAEYDSYYLGYSNSVLWPVFHYRLDLAQFRTDFLEGYRRVNRLFAQALAPLLREDDLVWVHDYHLIPLAAELRAMGCRHRIGFFLHVPLPPPPILAALPAHEWLMHALFAYDLIGLQSEEDARHFARHVQREGAAEALPGQRFRAFGRTLRAQAFPIGIDVDDFRAMCRGPRGGGHLRAHARRIREAPAARGRRPARLLQGPAAAHAGLQRAAASLSREPQQRHAHPGRVAVARVGGRVRGDPPGAGAPLRLDQRRIRRARLDARALPAPHHLAPAPARAVPGELRRARHAAARRHEPRRQGVHRGAGRGRPGRAGAVALRRRGRAVARGRARQSVRHPGHRRRHPARACACRARSARGGTRRCSRRSAATT